MRMLLACGDGLLLYEGMWKRADCPLRKPALIAHAGENLAVADNTAHLLYHGKLLACPRDVEALTLWREYALLLSSDTDTLSIADRDGWLITTRVGMYPQDMRLLEDSVIVCGGADGLVHHLSLPDLYPLQSTPVPGIVQRIDANGSTAFVLSTLDDEMLYTQLGQINLADGSYAEITHLPGIPGAVHGDGAGGIWAAATERLYHFPASSTQADAVFRGFGLIRHIDVREGAALVSDPITERCVLVTCPPDPELQILWRGCVEQACFL